MHIIDRIAAALPVEPGITTRQLSSKTGIPYEQCRGALGRLSHRRQISKFVEKNVTYWYGKPQKPKEKSGNAQPNRINKMTGHYSCPELSAPPARPGAMDAYNLPSKGLQP